MSRMCSYGPSWATWAHMGPHRPITYMGPIYIYIYIYILKNKKNIYILKKQRTTKFKYVTILVFNITVGNLRGRLLFKLIIDCLKNRFSTILKI